ncbi:hypothetical protein ACPUEK_12420 [Marinomonas gallaica]|uniref:hypothetical protein n=1 Tax=Marinomonas gallaica TaxID=1806667 RepID=UPI003CE53736
MSIKGIESYKESLLRSNIELTVNFQDLFDKIDKTPDLNGAGVKYIDSEYTIIELRPFAQTCLKYPTYVVFREPPKDFSSSEFASFLKQNQSNVREQKLVEEITNTAISCTGAILGWIAVIGSAGMVPISGGGSTVITYLSYGAAVAGTVQCFNGMYRVHEEAEGNGQQVDELSKQAWYKLMSSALEYISLAAASAAAATTLKSLKLFKASTGKDYTALLKGLSRAERRRLTLEVLRVNNPRVSNSVLKKMMGIGLKPKRYSSSAIKKAYAIQLSDAVSASLSIGGSIYSGKINSLAVGVWEEVWDE